MVSHQSIPLVPRHKKPYHRNLLNLPGRIRYGQLHFRISFSRRYTVTGNRSLVIFMATFPLRVFRNIKRPNGNGVWGFGLDKAGILFLLSLPRLSFLFAVEVLVVEQFLLWSFKTALVCFEEQNDTHLIGLCNTLLIVVLNYSNSSKTHQVQCEHNLICAWTDQYYFSSFICTVKPAFKNQKFSNTLLMVLR